MSTKLDTKHPWENGFQVCSKKGAVPLQRGNNNKSVKIGFGVLQIFFSRTTGQISTKLDTKRLWVKCFKVSLIEG